MTTEQRLALMNGSSAGSAASSAVDWTDYVFTNPTIGTAITATIVQSYSATGSAFFLLRNTSTAASPKTTFLNSIRLICGVAPASGTSFQYAIVLDGENSNRYSSAGTGPLFGANPDLNSTAASVTQLYAGALVTAAASSQARTVARGTLRGVIPVVGDQYVIGFGDGNQGSSFSSGTTAASQIVVSAPAISFGPQQFCLVHFWWPGNASTAATFEFEIGYGETSVP